MFKFATKIVIFQQMLTKNTAIFCRLFGRYKIIAYICTMKKLLQKQ